jgi:uncharacterized protein YnzC (UPF0291/DUF896 family)
MLSKDKIQRINELAKKSKSVGLTEIELEEQASLRKEYLTAFRQSFIRQLENIEIVDDESEGCGKAFKN